MVTEDAGGFLAAVQFAVSFAGNQDIPDAEIVGIHHEYLPIIAAGFDWFPGYYNGNAHYGRKLNISFHGF
jgi:hypothetical protein